MDEKLTVPEIKNKDKYLKLIKDFEYLREQRNSIVRGLDFVNTLS